jgi:hypothetical protein
MVTISQVKLFEYVILILMTFLPIIAYRLRQATASSTFYSSFPLHHHHLRAVSSAIGGQAIHRLGVSRVSIAELLRASKACRSPHSNLLLGFNPMTYRGNRHTRAYRDDAGLVRIGKEERVSQRVAAGK